MYISQQKYPKFTIFSHFRQEGQHHESRELRVRQPGQLQTRGPGQQRACAALPTGDDNDNYVINTDNDNDDIMTMTMMICNASRWSPPRPWPRPLTTLTARRLGAASARPQTILSISECSVSNIFSLSLRSETFLLIEPEIESNLIII